MKTPRETAEEIARQAKRAGGLDRKALADRIEQAILEYMGRGRVGVDIPAIDPSLTMKPKDVPTLYGKSVVVDEPIFEPTETSSAVDTDEEKS
jgi:hypothetical protein